MKNEFVLTVEQAKAFLRGYEMLLDEDEKRAGYNIFSLVFILPNSIRVSKRLFILNKMMYLYYLYGRE